MPDRAPSAHRRAIVAGVAGNVMEWYDFAVYGYFAQTIGQHFFPSENATASLIATFGVFAVGFLMRPLGGVVFGHIGDRFGRNAALVISVLAMAVPTCLIGILPGYAVIGPAASVLLTLLRMVQGLAVGGEFTTSIVFLVESGPPTHRGRLGRWGPFGATAGVLLGSSVGSLFASVLSPEDLAAWGWRAAFLVGLPLGLLGLLARRHLPEPVEVAKQTPAEGSPLIEAFRSEWRTIARIAAMNSMLAVGFYLAFVFAVTWLETFAHVSTAQALDVNTASMIVLLGTILLGGYLSDVFGRRWLLAIPGALAVALSWPLFALMHTGDATLIFLGQTGFAVIVGLFSGANPAAMAESVPVRVRCTAVSVGYNLSMGLVGGTTPMVATYLIERTHNDLSPAFMLMAAGALTFAVTRNWRPAIEETCPTVP